MCQKAQINLKLSHYNDFQLHDGISWHSDNKWFTPRKKQLTVFRNTLSRLHFLKIHRIVKIIKNKGTKFNKN